MKLTLIFNVWKTEIVDTIEIEPLLNFLPQEKSVYCPFQALWFFSPTFPYPSITRPNMVETNSASAPQIEILQDGMYTLIRNMR